MILAKRTTRRVIRGYRLTCRGLGKREFCELYSQLKDGVSAGAALRNPFLPQFGPEVVHEILLAGVAVAGATGKAALDLISAIVKRKLHERHGRKRCVTIYDYHGNVCKIVEVKPSKAK